MEKDSQLYEVGYILGADDEKSAQDFAASLKEAIVSGHGIAISESGPKIRNFAYPINKRISGYFGWVKFLINTELLEKIKKELEKQKIVFRYLLIKLTRETLQEPRKEKVVKLRKIAPEEKRVDIAEIDKKLEEILG